MAPFGMRAMMSLRLDKFFGSWMSEYSPDYTAAETGLERFIDFEKDADFIGRAAAEAERDKGPGRKLCAFEVDSIDADVHGYEPIWHDGNVVGFCTLRRVFTFCWEIRCLGLRANSERPQGAAGRDRDFGQDVPCQIDQGAIV